MEALKEIPKISPSIPFIDANTPRVVKHASEHSRGFASASQKASSIAVCDPQANSRPIAELHREQRGKQELFAWIGIAVIWAVSAVTVYILWIRATRGF